MFAHCRQRNSTKWSDTEAAGPLVRIIACFPSNGNSENWRRPLTLTRPPGNSGTPTGLAVNLSYAAERKAKTDASLWSIPTIRVHLDSCLWQTLNCDEISGPVLQLWYLLWMNSTYKTQENIFKSIPLTSGRVLLSQFIAHRKAKVFSIWNFNDLWPQSFITYTFWPIRPQTREHELRCQ